MTLEKNKDQEKRLKQEEIEKDWDRNEDRVVSEPAFTRPHA